PPPPPSARARPGPTRGPPPGRGGWHRSGGCVPVSPAPFFGPPLSSERRSLVSRLLAEYSTAGPARREPVSRDSGSTVTSPLVVLAAATLALVCSGPAAAHDIPADV